jgi:hypothetical protein
MDEFRISVAARFTALEFVLEIIVANAMLQMTDAQSATFKSEMTEQLGYIRNGLMDVDEMQAIAEQSQKMLENFFAKVSEREAFERAK